MEEFLRKRLFDAYSSKYGNIANLTEEELIINQNIFFVSRQMGL